jgi:hypothetical protein
MGLSEHRTRKERWERRLQRMDMVLRVIADASSRALETIFEARASFTRSP